MTNKPSTQAELIDYFNGQLTEFKITMAKFYRDFHTWELDERVANMTPETLERMDLINNVAKTLHALVKKE